MTSKKDTVATTKAQPEEQRQPDVAPMMWLPSGMALFVANFEGAIDTIEAQADALGLQTYYVLAAHKEKVEEKTKWVNKTTWSSPEPRIFKVINNFISQAAILAADDEAGLEHLPEIARFTMAKIPWLLVEKLDQFFKLVDKKLGTEAIVILTYDERCTGSEGWGILVPKQTNSSGSCKYDPTSVTDMIADEDVNYIRLVGTAHSHPGMTAFASHTDHGDQLGNDGIHITFGWPTKTRSTEHYIELTCGGTNFICTEEMVFADMPEPENFTEEVEELTKNVEKLTPGYGYGAWGGGGQKPYPPMGSMSGNGANGTYNSSEPRDRTGKPIVLPAGCPNIATTIIVAELLHKDDNLCPVCNTQIVVADIDRRKCWTCGAFLAMPGETIEQIIDIRRAIGINIAPISELLGYMPKPLHRWNRWVEAGQIHSSVDEIFAGKKA